MTTQFLRAGYLVPGLICVFTPTGAAFAQSYPNRVIRVIDAYAPGGSTDFLARVLSQKMAPSLGQNMVLEARPGAGGNLGAEVAAKSAPDGYTLFIAVSTAMASSVSIYRKLGYDVIRDLAPISTVGNGLYVFVSHPSLPVNSVKELIALAKARPGQINYASAGNGSGAHLSGELFKNLTGTDLVHVPYKGGAPSVTAVISGETEIAFMSAVSALAQIKVGKLRVLALTSAKRTNALPGVPTIEEAGVAGYRVVPMFALYAPAATPKEIIALLNREIRSAVESSEVRERYASQAVDAAASTPEEVRAILVAEIAQWEKVVRQTGMRVD